MRAPAKLTVSLRVTGVRADGYHLLESEMVAIDLADELEFDPDGDGLELIGATGLDVPTTDDNLVRRALRAVGRTAHVTLRKRIPAGAGLGGGSADAAAVLRWAGRGDDVELAATLGADVPFCLAGGGRALVRGIGDELQPLPFVDRTYTLLVPPFGVSTVAVYRAWDALGGPTGGAGVNDLEPAALHVEPRLAEWRDRLADAAGARPTLAGSGGTWFVEGEFPGDDRIVTRTVPEDEIG
jgi:4-diphosphocytidyl-2-C-methyl-D-erythritol kinase